MARNAVRGAVSPGHARLRNRSTFVFAPMPDPQQPPSRQRPTRAVVMRQRDAGCGGVARLDTEGRPRRQIRSGAQSRCRCHEGRTPGQTWSDSAAAAGRHPSGCLAEENEGVPSEARPRLAWREATRAVRGPATGFVPAVGPSRADQRRVSPQRPDRGTPGAAETATSRTVSWRIAPSAFHYLDIVKTFTSAPVGCSYRRPHTSSRSSSRRKPL